MCILHARLHKGELMIEFLYSQHYTRPLLDISSAMVSHKVEELWSNNEFQLFYLMLDISSYEGK